MRKTILSSFGAGFFAAFVADNASHSRRRCECLSGLMFPKVVSRCESRSDTKYALDPNAYKKLRLVQKQDVSHDTKLFRFNFPEGHSMSKAGLDVVSSLRTRAVLSGKEVVRQYTPVSPRNVRGYVDLIIKSYPAPGGLMSRHIHSLPIGGELEVLGPFLNFKYRENMKKRIGMIVGGTGLTPCLQLIREILSNPNDDTEVSLVFANKEKRDILLHDELNALMYLYPNFKVHFVLERAPRKWGGSTGIVSNEIVKNYIPQPSNDTMVLVCGPEGMVDHVGGAKVDGCEETVGGILKQLGFEARHVFKFR